MADIAVLDRARLSGTGVSAQHAKALLDKLDEVVTGVNSAGGSIRPPVANLSALKAIAAADLSDRMIVLCETLGLYRYDAQSTETADDDGVVTPTAVGVGAGRFIKQALPQAEHTHLLEAITDITASADEVNAAAALVAGLTATGEQIDAAAALVDGLTATGEQIDAAAALVDDLGATADEIDEACDLSAALSLPRVKRFALLKTEGAHEVDLGAGGPFLVVDIGLQVVTPESTGTPTVDVGAGGDADGLGVALSVGSPNMLRPGPTKTTGANCSYLSACNRGEKLCTFVAGSDAVSIDAGIYVEKPYWVVPAFGKLTYTVPAGGWTECVAYLWVYGYETQAA